MRPYAGRRVQTLDQISNNNWFPTPNFTSGNVTYYVYDGNDVALTALKSGTNSFLVRQRYLSEGTDGAIAARVRNSSSGAMESLALISDYQGTTVEAIQANGYEETNSQLYSRDAFGKLETTGPGGSTDVGTGFAGGSTPSSAGGFTYFRNRWYDPSTGRFLSQDPIGLGGGVNLYAYAGNAPTMFSDPFGLCRPVDNDPCNENTGDPNLDNPTLRQALETNVKSSPTDPARPGFSMEVGGWCDGAATCTKNTGDEYSVTIGEPVAHAALAYHSHPNEGMPLTRLDATRKALGLVHDVFRGVSDPDKTNAATRSVPTYIFSPNQIVRLQPNGTKTPDETVFQRWTKP